MRISDWSSDVCSSDLRAADVELRRQLLLRQALAGGVFEQADAIPDRAVQPLVPLARRGRLRRGVAVPRHRPAGGTAHPASSTACRNWRVRSLLGLLNSSRSEEHTSELQSLMRISYAVFCLKKKKNNI